MQATKLRCGAIVVACTFDHRIADAYSGNMFLVAWSEMARSKSISLRPSFRRSLLLHPHWPGTGDDASLSSLDSIYMPVSRLLPTPTPTPIVSRIYYVTADSISHLQARASLGTSRRTKLESLSAYLWQTLARSQMDGAKTYKMGIVVDGRTRLCHGPPTSSSMSNYFGNVLSIPFVVEKAEELATKPLSWVANAVHECVRGAATKEHFLGLIDWVEAHRPGPVMTKIYSSDGPAFVVSSGQQFPVSRVDFGWGRPVFGSYHFPWGGECGYVMPMPSASRDGDWVVYIHLLQGQLEVLEEEAGDVFQPLTAQYLHLSPHPSSPVSHVLDSSTPSSPTQSC